MKQAAAIAGAIILASCAPVDQPSTSVAAVEPAVRVVGDGQDCLSASRIRSTSVRGDGVIDFTLTGGQVYRNTLANRCPALSKDDAITYDVNGGSLCRGEIVYELDDYGNGLERGPACSLGSFVPVEYADKGSDAR